jgi:adenosylhomocysteine nucleosidase
MSGVTLVCFAVPQEAKPFRVLARQRNDVHVVITGIGRQNAERAVRAALEQCSPARVLTCGFAGALDPSLRVGDVVFDSETTSENIAAVLTGLKARPVRFHCGERVAVTAAEKSALRAATKADAVEMESRAIHELCAAGNVECATVRAISDAANEDLPVDFNRIMTAEQKLSGARLTLAILKSPQKIPALLRLGSNSALAARELARVLGSLIELQ